MKRRFFDTMQQAITIVCVLVWPFHCTSLDERMRTTQGEFKSGDLVNAAQHFEQLCDLNLIAACERLSSMHLLGQGVPENLSIATQFAKKAMRLAVAGCSKGDPRSCESIGMTLISVRVAEIQVVDMDLIRSYCPAIEPAYDADVAGVRLLLRACDSSIPSACNTAGALISAGRGEKQDFSRMRMLYGKACDFDYGLGCYNLARLYEHRASPNHNFAEAMRLFRKACDLKEAFSCFDLAQNLVNGGLNVPKNPAESVKLLQKLCDDNEGYGCHALGRILISGQVVPRDWNRGVQLYKKACDLKNKRACADWNAVRNE